LLAFETGVNTIPNTKISLDVKPKCFIPIMLKDNLPSEGLNHPNGGKYP
jgi:hypothetical protein